MTTTTKETTMTPTLTVGSHELFTRLAEDAPNWNGTPLLPDLTPQQKGHLTDLKKKGLLEVETLDGCPWVFFLPAGLELARAMGIRFFTY